MKELARHQEVWPSGFAFAAYLGIGDKEQAMDWLERSYEQKEYEMMALLKLHPMLDPLRDEPRFERLVEKVFQITKRACRKSLGNGLTKTVAKQLIGPS
jgi:hypothetical protein